MYQLFFPAHDRVKRRVKWQITFQKPLYIAVQNNFSFILSHCPSQWAAVGILNYLRANILEDYLRSILSNLNRRQLDSADREKSKH